MRWINRYWMMGLLTVIGVALTSSCKEEIDGDKFNFLQPTVAEVSDGWEYKSFLPAGEYNGEFQFGKQCPILYTAGRPGRIVLDFPEWFYCAQCHEEVITCEDTRGAFDKFYIFPIVTSEEDDESEPANFEPIDKVQEIPCGLEFTIHYVKNPLVNSYYIQLIIAIDELDQEFKGDELTIYAQIPPLNYSYMKIIL